MKKRIALLKRFIQKSAVKGNIDFSKPINLPSDVIKQIVEMRRLGNGVVAIEDGPSETQQPPVSPVSPVSDSETFIGPLQSQKNTIVQTPIMSPETPLKDPQANSAYNTVMKELTKKFEDQSVDQPVVKPVVKPEVKVQTDAKVSEIETPDTPPPPPSDSNELTDIMNSLADIKSGDQGDWFSVLNGKIQNDDFFETLGDHVIGLFSGRDDINSTEEKINARVKELQQKINETGSVTLESQEAIDQEKMELFMLEMAQKTIQRLEHITSDSETASGTGKDHLEFAFNSGSMKLFGKEMNDMIYTSKNSDEIEKNREEENAKRDQIEAHYPGVSFEDIQRELKNKTIFDVFMNMKIIKH